MKRLAPILAVNFVGTLGMSIVVPFLVILVNDFGGNGVVYGIVAAAYPAFQLIGSPLLGRWSDRFGRKPILLLSQLGTAFAWVIFFAALLAPRIELAVVNSTTLGMFTISVPVMLLFVARAFDGLTGGNVSVANAYLADLSTNDNRARNFGLLSVSSNLGFILGPALAGLLGATARGAQLPVAAAFAISVVGVVLILALVPNAERRDPLRPTRQRTETCHCPHAATSAVDDVHAGGLARHRANRTGLKQLLKTPNVGLFLVLYFVLFLGFNVFYAVFPVHAVSSYGWSTAQMGAFFSTMSLAMVVVQGPGLQSLSKRVSPSGLVLAGSAILALCFVTLMFGGPALAFVAALLFAAGNGIMWPSFLSLLASLVSTEHQGEVQGYGASAGGAASLVGLVFGGVLYELFGPATFAVSGAAFLSVVLVGVLKKWGGTATPQPVAGTAAP